MTDITRRRLMTAGAVAFGSVALASTEAWAAGDEEISRVAESIHQETTFNAAPHRVYEALMDSAQFDKVIEISGVLKELHLGSAPAQISREVGGGFSIFGGYITGRQIELVPDKRIVQAWREGSWKPGIFSIAKFELVAQGAATLLVFDQAGFPKGAAEGLASGWKSHYWEPMAKLLE